MSEDADREVPLDVDRDSWARNERERRLIGLNATPAQRLAWLEAAIELAYRTGALPKRNGEDSSGAPADAD